LEKAANLYTIGGKGSLEQTKLQGGRKLREPFTIKDREIKRRKRTLEEGAKEGNKGEIGEGHP